MFTPYLKRNPLKTKSINRKRRINPNFLIKNLTKITRITTTVIFKTDDCVNITV